MRSSIFLLILALILGACAGRSTVSENQCAAGDWRTLGYRDGANGYRSSRLLDHQDACLDHDIVPDRGAYMAGWERGIREYCEPNNGFRVGENGWQHNNACPTDLRADFQKAWLEGRKLYQARVDVANLERELAHKTARLSEVKSRMVSAAAAQFDGNLTSTERIELAARVQRLNEERQSLRTDIPRIESELELRTRELDRLTTTLASVVY